MQEEIDSRNKLVAHLETLPAEQVKQTVLKLIMGSKKEDLTIFTKNFPISIEDQRQKKELSPSEKAHALRKWAESHHSDLPPLSNQAISRESIYEDEHL